MQRRFGLMGFTSLLLIASLASAETPPQPSAPEAPQSSVTAAAPGAAPFCPASLFTVQSLTATTSGAPCGACSYSSCQGKPFYSSCYYVDRFGAHLARCVPNQICEDNSLWCNCTNDQPQ
jgi:hypothetical protein